jgi:hypothetical protein
MKKLFILLALFLCSCGKAQETETCLIKAEVMAKWQVDFLISKLNYIIVLYEDLSLNTKIVSDKTYLDVNVGDVCVFQETLIKEN